MIAVVVIRPSFRGAKTYNGVFPDHKRDTQIAVLFIDPARPSLFLAGEEICPEPFRQIVLGNALIIEDGRNQKSVSQHVLLIHVMTGLIPGIFQNHAPHGGDSGTGGIHGGLIQIRHQPCLQSGKKPNHVHSLLVVSPGNTIGGASVKSRMGGEQAKGYPALVDVCGGGALETADIMSPEAETAHQQRETAAQTLLHGFIIRPAVAAPVYRKFLSAHGCGAGKQYGLPFSPLSFQELVDTFIIEVRVVIVHLLRIRAVKIDHVL